MAIYPLTGIDLSDPTPGTKRELKTNRGVASGSTATREAVILCNKLASVGDGSVDGLGEALNFPRLVSSEQDVIDRAGNGSEAQLLFKAFVAANGTTTPVHICLVPPGSGSGTVDFTFATTSTGASAVRISCIGETIEVPVATGDLPATTAAAVEAAIDAQLHWPVSASVSSAVVTVTTKAAGTRHDHHLNRIRMSFSRPVAMTVSKGSVTPGSSDDDQTTAIANLDSFEIYYHVNPKSVTSGVTSTDNGIGEHLAAINSGRLPAQGREQMLCAAGGGTAAQAVTVAQSMNSEWSHYFHAEDNDWSPGQVAAHCTGVVALAQATDRAANIADYGKNQSTQPFRIPDPFDRTDRATPTEIKTLLNGGVSPVAFTSTGVPYIVDLCTTRTLTNGVTDYRARSGHIPSVITEYWQRLRNRYASVKQPKIADDPADGQKPIAGFNYPRDVRALMSAVIDDMVADGQLDPSPEAIAAMKASIDVGRLLAGFSARVQIAAVRHNKKQWFLVEEVSPAI